MHASYLSTSFTGSISEGNTWAKYLATASEDKASLIYGYKAGWRAITPILAELALSPLRVNASSSRV